MTKARTRRPGPRVAARPKRVRRRPEEARRLILQAAEALLVAGGIQEVTVRSVARRVGMTDMGVNHHYGTVTHLLEALLEDVAARLRERLARLSEQWLEEGARLNTLVDLLAGAYTPNHTKLAIALYEAGWRDRSAPLLEPVVSTLHVARERHLGKRLDIDETKTAVAAMHQALALDPAFGREFRRSAGLTGAKAKDPTLTRRFWLNAMAQRLGIPP